MAEYNLGRVAFVDKGAYSVEETYNKWDFVTTEDSTYLFIGLAPQIGKPVTDTGFWKCIADGKPATLAAAAATLAKEAANSAAALANDKAVLAQSNATLANTKAGLANDAAILATDKAALADSKATLANDKAILAQSAADNANAKAAEVTAAVLSAGSLGSIKPTDAAPTPARNGNYKFSIGGNKPAWLTAEAGITEVKAGDGVAVVYDGVSVYTYTHVDTGGAFLLKTEQTLNSLEQLQVRQNLDSDYSGNPFIYTGKFIEALTGLESTAVTTRSCTPFYLIDRTKDIKVKGVGHPNAALVAFFDVNYIFISSIYGVQYNNILTTIPIASIPVDARFIRANCETAVGGLLYANNDFSFTNRELIQLRKDNKTNFDALKALIEPSKITNKITNGNFTSSTNWVPVNGTAVVASNKLTYTCTALLTASAIRNEQFTPIANNLYYISVKINPKYSNSTKIYFADQNESYVFYPQANVDNTIYAYIRATSNSQLRIGHDTTTQYQAGDSFSIKECIAINLTEIFGQGNEPSEKIIDELLSIYPNVFNIDAPDLFQRKHISNEVYNEVEKSIDLIDDRSSIDLNYSQIEILNSYKESLDSLMKLEGIATGSKTIIIPSIDKEVDNYIMRLGVHYRENRGAITPDFDEVYLDQLCKSDFSDLRFEDEDGNLLDFRIQSHGNYDFVKDSRLKYSVGILSNNTLVGSVPGVRFSVDNGVTWIDKFTGNNIELSFIDNLDRLFIFDNVGIKLYLSTSTDNYGSKTEIVALTPFLQMNTSTKKPAIRVIMNQDDNGALYLAKYTLNADSEILKSVDGGITWVSVFQSYANHHVHSISIDKTKNPNVIYIGLDGIGTGDLRPKCYKSSDGGTTWSLLPIPFNNADYGLTYFDSDFRLGFGETNVLGGPSIYKTKDDFNFYPVLDIHSRAFQVVKYDDVLFASILAEAENRMEQIFKSLDDGETWELANSEKYKDDNTVGSGKRIFTEIVTPTGSLEEQIIASGGGTPLRIFNGGNNYYAFIYVNVGKLPLTGRSIKIKYGYPIKYPKKQNFKYDLFDSNLVFRMRLSEGRGRYVREDVNGENYLLPVGTPWLKSDVRYGSIYPFMKPYKTSAILMPVNGVLKISNTNIIPDRNFSVTFWTRFDRASAGRSKFIIGSQSGVRVQIYGADYLSITDGVNEKHTSTPVLPMNLLGDSVWHFVAITVSNDSLPVINVFRNMQWLGSAVTTAWNPPSTNPSTYAFGCENGSSYRNPISNISVYNRELSKREIRDLYIGYNETNVSV